MRNERSILSVILFILFGVVLSCNQNNQQDYQTGWLGTSQQEIYENIEEQFQGFSRTMVEVLYRYQELYWAGMDENWDYADYQHEHIIEALDQGFLRRPERELSSRSFMTVAMPEMEAAIQSNDSSRFTEAFSQLINSCNTCHQMEEVAFIRVTQPTERVNAIRF
jgi:hypothetical protein